jgi:hypothetical protein
MRDGRKKLNESLKLSSVMAKCLVSPQNLTLKDLQFMSKYSFGDLIVDFSLNEFEAHCLTNNLKYQLQRLVNQNIYYPLELREVKKAIKENYTESFLDSAVNAFSNLISNPSMNTQKSSGRMLDYGSSMSDSEEGQMIRSSLNSINRASAELYEALNDHDDIPQWCHYKVAQAEMMISKVRDYLVYKIDNLD